MKFFIIAPTLTVHIEDEHKTRHKIKKTAHCGVQSFDGVTTHAFTHLSFKTGETLRGCRVCESVFFSQHDAVVRNRGALEVMAAVV